MKNAEWMIKNGIKFTDVGLAQPYENGYFIVYISRDGKVYKNLGKTEGYDRLNAFEKWLEAEHVEPILTEKERDYLETVIKPFRDKIIFIRKNLYSSIPCRFYIHIDLDSRNWCTLPMFSDEDNLFDGMELGKKYTLKELGL